MSTCGVAGVVVASAAWIVKQPTSMRPWHFDVPAGPPKVQVWKQ